MTQVIFNDIGYTEYQKAWDYQEDLFDQVVETKVRNRKLEEGNHIPLSHYLIFCEHPHVYTLGKSGVLENLLLNNEMLKEKGVSFFKINRGGDITYHGPGQIVGYPILDLDGFFTDIHKYLRYLEEIIIRTLDEYGVKGERHEGATGVWLDVGDPEKERKICAMGVRCSRWVTMHGFAFNVNTDLDFFNHIVPCGIADKSVTSLAAEIGYELDVEEVKGKLKKHFEAVFEAELVEGEGS